MPVMLDTAKVKRFQARERLREKGDSALDEMWGREWMNSLISTEEADQMVSGLSRMAEEIRERADRIVIVAEGPLYFMIDGALKALGSSRAADRIILMGSSLSAADYEKTLHHIRGKKTVMTAVAVEPESEVLLAAYVTVKKAIVDRAGGKNAGKDIVIAASPRAEYLRKEAADEGLTLIDIPKNILPEEAAGTAAMAFPLFLMGIDGKSYIEGFREMIADPWWDQDAPEYALDLSMAAASEDKGFGHGLIERVVYWQSELSGVCRWISSLHQKSGILSRAVFMPEAGGMLLQNERDPEGILPSLLSGKTQKPETLLWQQEYGYETHVFLENEDRDIMMPLFPGGDPGGSLNQMTRENAEEYFEQMSKARRAALKFDFMTPEEYGRLSAFLQMSALITGKVCGV